MTGFASLIALLASAPASAGAFDFFPLQQGNLWVYETATGHHVVRVNDDAQLSNGWYASDAEGLLSGATWIYDNTGVEQMYSYNNGWSALFDFGAQSGDSWQYAASGCDTFDVEATDAADITTPAGEFEGVATFDLAHSPTTSGCAAPPIAGMGFAEGIGPVHFTDPAGNMNKLIYARVDGSVVAMAPGATDGVGGLELSLVITNDRPMQADSVGVLVVVTNTSDTAETITLPTGQPFVIDIFERLSDGSVGSSAVESWQGGTGGEMTLQAGDSHILFGEIALDAALSGDHIFEGTLSSDANLPTLSVDVAIQ